MPVGLVLLACGGRSRIAEESEETVHSPPLPGLCTTTDQAFSGDLGGLEGADILCDSLLPGSHFYRTSRDGKRSWMPNGAPPMGHGDLELGACWDCNGWSTASSGDYGNAECATGYSTVGALVPSPVTSPEWRICEGAEWPLACCMGD